jgi:hypothetical protein
MRRFVEEGHRPPRRLCARLCRSTNIPCASSSSCHTFPRRSLCHSLDARGTVSTDSPLKKIRPRLFMQIFHYHKVTATKLQRVLTLITGKEDLFEDTVCCQINANEFSAAILSRAKTDATGVHNPETMLLGDDHTLDGTSESCCGYRPITESEFVRCSRHRWLWLDRFRAKCPRRVALRPCRSRKRALAR